MKSKHNTQFYFVSKWKYFDCNAYPYDIYDYIFITLQVLICRAVQSYPITQVLISCKTFGIIVETINQVHTNTNMKLKDTTTVAVNRKLLLRLEDEPNEIHEPCTKPNEQNTCITASTQIGRTNKSLNCELKLYFIVYVFIYIGKY